MNIAYAYTTDKQEDGTFLVQFAQFEEAFTEGSSAEEVAHNAAEVLSLVIEQRLADGADVPRPKISKAKNWASPTAVLQAALLLRWAREDNGTTLSDLARAMETSWPVAQRLEQATGNPTLKQLERAAAALGKRLVVGLA